MATRSSGRSGGLGRGLGSLLANTSADIPAPSAAVDDAGGAAAAMSVDAPGRYAELPISAINPNPRQPRDVFDPEALAELVHSIKEIGLLQPVVVRPLGEGRYELVAGERRLRASTAAGMTAIPAIIRETADADLLRDALLENLHRADLNAIEEAAAYQQLLEDFGCTQEELATRIGRSRPQVTNTLRLLKLPAPVQKRVAAGILSAGHAKALAGVSDAAACEALAVKVVAQGLSVRALEEVISAKSTATGQRNRTPRARQTSDQMLEVSQLLSELLETRVTVSRPKSGRLGSVMIEFADDEDLARIVKRFRQ